jgi:hypothetical protein
MPNEVGKGLQTSQNHLEAIGGDPLYYSDSRDALGPTTSRSRLGLEGLLAEHRPGTRVTSKMTVTFRLVKLDKICF